LLFAVAQHPIAAESPAIATLISLSDGDGTEKKYFLPGSLASSVAREKPYESH
jgi:hypothetical protein